MHHIYTDEEMLRRLKRSPGIASFWALRHFDTLVATRRRELLLEARRSGWSWYDLAVALGVSRQAVQQQWRRLVEPEQEPDG